MDCIFPLNILEITRKNIYLHKGFHFRKNNTNSRVD